MSKYDFERLKPSADHVAWMKANEANAQTVIVLKCDGCAVELHMDDGYVCTKPDEPLGSASRRIHELAGAEGWKYERKTSRWACDQCLTALAVEATSEGR